MHAHTHTFFYRHAHIHIILKYIEYNIYIYMYYCRCGYSAIVYVFIYIYHVKPARRLAVTHLQRCFAWMWPVGYWTRMLRETTLWILALIRHILFAMFCGQIGSGWVAVENQAVWQIVVTECILYMQSGYLDHLAFEKAELWELTGVVCFWNPQSTLNAFLDSSQLCKVLC